MESELRHNIERYCGHIRQLSGISCFAVPPGNAWEEGPLCPLCGVCMQYGNYDCNGWKFVREGCREAMRWSQPYMSLCPCGLLLVATFITDQKGAFAGGITSEPLCAGSMEVNLQLAVSRRLRSEISAHPCYSMEQIQGLAEILDAVSSNLSGSIRDPSARYFREQRHQLNQEFVKRIRSMVDGDTYLYPIALERKLRIAVNGKNREGAMVLLNQILAYIFTANNYALGPIKVRLLELLTVLSRAAADAGADFARLQIQSDSFRDSLAGCHSLESLSAWVSGILQEYLNAIFDLKKNDHGPLVRQVAEYVEQHYREKIRLSDLAREVHLSASYLCTVFKEDTGESLSGYINRIRVSHARILLQDSELTLVEVANFCGFEDQSYFTKIFRSYTGITPRKYRQKRSWP